MTIAKNLVTDYGAPTNGTSDCRAAILAFKADAQGQDAVLTIPAGHTYNIKANTGTSEDVKLFNGIPSLTVNMTGATITDDAGAGNFSLGGTGEDTTIHAFPRIATALMGSNTITLLNSGDASSFAVGRYIIICSFDLQGLWQSGFGSPQNNQWVEYAKVTAINGSVLTLDRTLQFSHQASWPWYSQGATDGPDQCGPATAVPLPANWDIAHTYQGGTWNLSTANAINCPGRSIIFDGATIIGSRGMNPSNQEAIRFKDCDLQFGMEVDKLLGKIVFEGSTQMLSTNVEFQSASGLLEIRDTVHLLNVNGTPRKTVAYGTGWRIENLLIGPHFYGKCDEVTFDAGRIDAWSGFGGQQEQGNNGEGVNVSYTMDQGIIRVPNSLGAKPWAVPGARCFFTGQESYAVPFIVGRVWQDATYTYVQTSRTGTWPNIPLTSGKLYINVHPSIRATFAGGITTSDRQIADFAQATPGRPLYEYSNRSYDKTATAGAFSITIVGKVNYLRINVTSAYSGAQNPLTLGVSFTIYGADDSRTTYTATINLRQAGMREIAPSGITGIQSGDTIPSLPSGSYNWIAGVIGFNPDVNVSGESTALAFNIAVSTDQGFPTEAVTSLQMRLRS